MRLARCGRGSLVGFGMVAAGHPDDPCGPMIVRCERCRLVFWASLTKHMRFLGTKPVGAWRNGGARALGVPGAYAV